MNSLTRRLTLVLALSLICLSSCTKQGSVPEETTLQVNLGSEPPSLDWGVATDSTSHFITQQLGVGLFEFDKDLNIVPVMVKKYESSPDKLRWVFHLRDDVYWTDGKKVVAGDYEYAWKRILDPKTASERAQYFFILKNGQDYQSGKIKDSRLVGVKALDDVTLEVLLEKPKAHFLVIFSAPFTFPIRKDVIEKHGDKWTEPQNIVTNGPYKLENWEHDYRITLVRNENYFGPKPKIKKIVSFMVNEQQTQLNLYESKKIDLIHENLPSIDIPKLEKRKDFHRYPLLATYYYGFNVTKPPFTDPRVRKAFSMAIYREEIVKLVKGGQTPITTWMPPGMKEYNSELGVKNDIAAAKKLLAEAGYPEGKGLPKIILAFNTSEGHQMIAENVQFQLKKNLGIEVKLENMEWKVFLKNLETDPPQMFRMGWIGSPDPDDFMNIFLSDSTQNRTKWKNAKYDEFVKAAMSEFDPQKQKKLYDEAQKILVMEEIPIMPFYAYTQNFLVRPYVEDLLINAVKDLQFKTAYLNY